MSFVINLLLRLGINKLPDYTIKLASAFTQFLIEGDLKSGDRWFGNADKRIGLRHTGLFFGHLTRKQDMNMDNRKKGRTLIARRPNAGQRGATITAYRCVDTGSMVLTNRMAKPMSPYTGGRMEIIKNDETLDVASNYFDASLVKIATCQNEKCGVDLYTAKDEVASFSGETCHCPICSNEFTVSAAEELETEEAKKSPPGTDPEMDEDFDSEVVMLEDDEGDDSDGEEVDISIDDDGYYVDSEGNYVDEEGNPVDEPISADSEEEEVDTGDEGDDSDEEEASMKHDLDVAVIYMVNGYAKLAEESGLNIENASHLTDKMRSLTIGRDKTRDIATDNKNLSVAKCFEIALALGSDTVTEVYEKITGSSSDLSKGFEEASAIIKGKVDDQVQDLWDTLSKTFASINSDSIKKTIEQAQNPDAKEDIEPEIKKDEVDETQVQASGNASDQDEQEEVSDKETTDIDVDVTASLDFDPRTLIVTPVSPGSFGVFVTVAKTVTPAGMILAANASDDNKHMFENGGKPDLIRRALCACIEEQSDYTDIGFVPITAKVAIDNLVVDQVVSKVEETTASLEKKVEETVDDFKQSMQIATAGMNKGFYKNPLLASLSMELRRRGLKNSNTVAARIVSTVADDYMGAVIEKASELMASSLDARNAVAKVVAEADTNLVDEVEEEEAMVSTASIPTPKPETAAEGTSDDKNVVPLRRSGNLFSDVGYGGLR